VAVQFSLSYDANGDPVLVENTVTGTRKVISRSTVVSPYKARFESAASGDPITDAEENQPDNNQSAIMDYIMEMEKGASDDPNLSFVQKQNLERYTPDAIEARSKEKSPGQKIIETVMSAVLPFTDAATAAVKALEAILPAESEEIKAIKRFYADPEQQQLVESIPGMSNYNLVYGNPLDPSYGLADAAAKRTATMEKTLRDKYKMTAAEIAMAKAGTYTGPVDSDIIQRIKKTTDLEKKERGEITRIKEQRAKDLADMRGAVGRPTDDKETQQVTFDNSGMNRPVSTGDGGSPAQQAETRSKDLTGGPGKDYGPFSR
jgi:hypothetical protein